MPLEEIEGKPSRDAEYRSRILAAAKTLFDNNGYDSVNMYQIAQEAGIGQGTLYRRYEHLGEICSDLLRTSLERFVVEMEAAHAGYAAPFSAFDRLYDTIVKVVRYIDDNAELLTAINCMYAGKKKSIIHKRPLMQRLRDLIVNDYNLAAEQGETGAIDATLTANFLIASLMPEHYLYHRDELGYGQEGYLAGIRRLFIDGLQKRG
ncbi:TetR family transcriptional regulator [Cohnella sp. CFH 77786]|uniref:TetR/AcrR family transcriptional regulator n=1 Tax=Cohnella sp. CFH 77786 TaxID=2662265 RepID=UPI001C60AC3C|nr:TetR/AcrR family transcriptional regulator [Cohnella sp. CFH 77786]MBW5448880.1 TetR family transcriptional regulator [Cohnella sp. CFH 77786]